MSLRGNIIINFFQLKANSEINRPPVFVFVNECYGVTKSPKMNDYLLVFDYAYNGDLHNNLLKNFEEITWKDKIKSLYWISVG